MVEFDILSPEYIPIGTLRDVISYVWEVRYYDAGLFEIWCVPSDHNWELARKNYRVRRSDDDRMLCVIDTYSENTDEDGKTKLVISGRGVLSLLDRRIVAQYRVYKRNHPVKIMRSLVNANAIAPDDSNRIIPRLAYTSQNIAASQIDGGQFRGDTLLAAVSSVCKSVGLGVRAVLSDRVLTIEHYAGADRTQGQNKNKPVILSAENGSLESSEWMDTISGMITSAYVAGEGEGATRRVVLAGEDASGEDRYELFVDARDITTDDGDGGTLSNSEYNAQLVRRGYEKIAEAVVGQMFDVAVNPGRYVCGTDYDVGDICTVIVGNVTAAVRIIAVGECGDDERTSWDLTIQIIAVTYDRQSEGIVYLQDGWFDTLEDGSGNPFTEDDITQGYLLDGYGAFLTDGLGVRLED